jgi:hypothetical protein
MARAGRRFLLAPLRPTRLAPALRVWPLVADGSAASIQFGASAMGASVLYAASVVPVSPSFGDEVSNDPGSDDILPTLDIGVQIGPTFGDIDVQVSDDPAFGTITWSDSVTGWDGANTRWTPQITTPLADETLFYWRVRLNGGEWRPTTFVTRKAIEDGGWWVEVYSPTSDAREIGRIYDFKALSFRDAMNDVGFGEVTLYDTDQVFQQVLGDGSPPAEILTHPHYFRVMWDNREVFRFRNEEYNRLRADPNDAQRVVIRGPGRGHELTFGVVLPAGWNSGVRSSRNPRKFVKRTWAYVFLTLLNEAKARGEIPSTINPTFTTSRDTYGAGWAYKEDFSIDCGRDMRDVLDDLAAKAGVSWRIRPNGYMDAAPVVGWDASMRVRFFDEIDVIECEDTYSREETRTAVYVSDVDDKVSVATDATQIARWGRRATWVNATEVQGATKRQRVADAVLRALKTERLARRLKVDHNPVDVDTAYPMGRRMFHNYGIGALIGYGQKQDGAAAGNNDYRVMEIGLSIEDGVVDAEIVVQTKWQSRTERYERIVDRLLRGKANTGGNTADATYSNLGFGGGGMVYVQPDDPGDTRIGVLWFDTDAEC